MKFDVNQSFKVLAFVYGDYDGQLFQKDGLKRTCHTCGGYFSTPSPSTI